MREIEKIVEIRAKLDINEQKALDSALKSVNNAFKAMVMSSKDYMLNGDGVKVSLDDAKNALNVVKSLADKAGAEMPEFDTDEKVKAYVLKYGMEIVKTR